MHFLMRANAGQFEDSMHCDFVLIDMTRNEFCELTNVAKKLKASQQKKERYLSEVVFMCGIRVVSSEDVAKLLGITRDDVFSIEGITHVSPTDAALAELPEQRVECELVHVSDHHIHWTFTPKHAEIELFTDPLYEEHFKPTKK